MIPPAPQIQRIPRILLVGLSAGVGGLHLPRHLARAGLEVVFIGSEACLVSRSSHVRAFYPWPSDDNGLAVLPFIQCVMHAQPDWVIPLDEISAQMLQQFGVGQLQGAQYPLPHEVVQLVRRSLGDPAGYPHFAVRRRAFETARAAAIPVAPQADADTLEACMRFVRTHGYPTVLKQETSSGGAAAFILDNDAALKDFLASDTFARTGQPWVIQGFIPGRLGMHAVFAWQGRVLAQLSALQLTQRTDRPTAPSSVVELIRHEAMAAHCAAFVAARGASGFHGWDFQLDANGHAVMIEHNPRPISISHLGYLLGDDLCLALAGVCGGNPVQPRPNAGIECHERRVALFPDEWQRDSSSPMLHAAFHDAPWDDPMVFKALMEKEFRFV
jgi:hypothetical protein